MPADQKHLLLRRSFLGSVLGGAALNTLIGGERPAFPNLPATAKRVIYLFQHGGPSQLDLFDYKPQPGEAARARTCPLRYAWANG